MTRDVLCAAIVKKAARGGVGSTMVISGVTMSRPPKRPISTSTYLFAVMGCSFFKDLSGGMGGGGDGDDDKEEDCRLERYVYMYKSCSRRILSDTAE